jgi:lysozyme
MMIPSQTCLDLIASFEGLKLISYQDGNKIWTIGYGHTGRDVYPGKVITKEEAEVLLQSDLSSTATYLNEDIKVPITQNQFDALVSLVYNIGIGNFSHSTCFRCLNEKQYTAAADAILLWRSVAGKPSAGLIRRREAEKALFLKG